jgi:hypothetical protein
MNGGAQNVDKQKTHIINGLCLGRTDNGGYELCNVG